MIIVFDGSGAEEEDHQTFFEEIPAAKKGKWAISFLEPGIVKKDGELR